jgi:hypothetical protein
MPRVYDNCLALCPFFHTSGKQHISGVKARDYIKCEGITNDCTIDIVFVTEDKRDLHRKNFCDSRYKNCEIFKALEKKYEDE